MKVTMILLIFVMVFGFVGASAPKKTKTIRFDNDRVYSIQYLPDGSRLAASHFRRYVTLWDIQTGKLIWKHDFDDRSDKTNYIISEIHDLSVSRDGSMIAAAVLQERVVNGWLQNEQNARIVILDPSDGHILQTLQTGSVPVGKVAISPDGTLIATGAFDGTSRIWSLSSGKQISEIKLSSGISVLIFSPDGRFLVVGRFPPRDFSIVQSPPAIVWDLTKGEEVREFQYDSLQATGAAFSPDGRMLALSGTGPQVVNLLDTESWEVNKLAENEFKATDLVFSNDNSTLFWLTGFLEDGFVFQFDVTARKRLKTLTIRPGPTSIAISPVRHEFAVGTVKGRIYLFRY